MNITNLPSAPALSAFRVDPGDEPRCRMERLADRLEDCPKPKWLSVIATRTAAGTAMVELTFEISYPDSIDDVVAYLERAKG